MSDLISRQAAIDALGDVHPLDYNAIAVRNRIKALPSAEPQIIRCKECKHWVKTEGDDRWSLGNCSFWEKRLVMCNGFCAWAEEDEE